MWPFSHPPRDPEPSDIIYQGGFTYAGGLRSYDQPGSVWRAARIVVTADGVTYRERARGVWRDQFTLPAGSIIRVDQIAWIPPRVRRGEAGLGRYVPGGTIARFPGDFITIEVRSSEGTDTAGFRTTTEGAAFALYGALNEMLGRYVDVTATLPTAEDLTPTTWGGDPEPVDVLHTGRYTYAGGHPLYGKSSALLRTSPVYVTRDGATYRERVRGVWRNRFTIPVTFIKDIRHTTLLRGGFGYPGTIYLRRLHLVLIDMDYKGRTFVVRFKASSEQAAARLHEALDAMVAQASAA